MSSTKSLGQKNKFDKFYTKPEIVDLCLKEIDLNKYDCIIEPSAGNGSFSKKLNCIAYDIEPEDSSIIKKDFLTLDKSVFKKYNNILVIGNPPFGVQNNLAISFFNESAKFCNTIAFILPLSFKKQSIINRLDLNFNLKKEIILNKNSFTLNGNDYSVPCVFQIWEKDGVIRKKIKQKTKSELFDFVDRKDADFRIQRVGGNAGKASSDLNVSKQSNYFIKNNTELTNKEFIDIINSINFKNRNFSVGPRSLSKSELINEIEKTICPV